MEHRTISTYCDRIEVFILTCNRAELLRKSLASVVGQTLHGFPITVLDNASTDHTADVVASFSNPDLKSLVAPKNLGGLGNVRRAQELASRPYVMIFHDDDQLDARYLERAVAYLDATPHAKIAVANCVTIPAGSVPNPVENISTSAVVLNTVEFATLLYMKNRVAFCSAIYRLEALRSIDLSDLDTRFGKWGDRPIMIEAARGGSAISLSGAYVFCGRHAAQDTHHADSQPPHVVWLNRERYFRDILGCGFSSFSAFCFAVMSPRRLKSGFRRRVRKNVEWPRYLQDAFELGAADPTTWRLRWLTIPAGSLVSFLLHRRQRRKYRMDLPVTADPA